MTPLDTLPALNPHAAAVLGLTLFALVLFTRDNIALETSSLFVLAVLTVGFELFPYGEGENRLHAVELFSGFGHEALVAVCALMIAGHGLVRTGALEPVGRLLVRAWIPAPGLSLLLTLIIGGTLSAFVNNVPIVVLLLPILVSVSLRSGNPPAGVLMPMGFATLVGGMATTIGTSTNLLVVSVATDLGLQGFDMFDFALPVAAAGAVALAYLWLLAPRLLPPRGTELGDASPRVFNAQLTITPDSVADGATLAEIKEKAGGTIQVMRILRGERTALVPLPDTLLHAGDRLLVRDTAENLKECEASLGVTLGTEGETGGVETMQGATEQQLAEVVITQSSALRGSTLAGAHFGERYGLLTLALHRAGWHLRAVKERPDATPLRTGDVVLVQGSREQVSEVRRRGDLLVLDATTDLPGTRLAPVALLVMAGIILSAAFGWLPIAISAVVGVLVMIGTGCLSWRDAAHALNTQVILIVAASLALGVALLHTGAADYLAARFVDLTHGLPAGWMLSGLMLLMALMTNIVSNNAAAVIGTPVAIGIARQLDLPAEPFVLAVLFGANMSYATPIAYKTNLLVMSAGGYRFSDFLRVGIPLTLIMWGMLSWLLPSIYGLGW